MCSRPIEVGCFSKFGQGFLPVKLWDGLFGCDPSPLVCGNWSTARWIGLKRKFDQGFPPYKLWGGFFGCDPSPQLCAWSECCDVVLYLCECGVKVGGWVMCGVQLCVVG